MTNKTNTNDKYALMLFDEISYNSLTNEQKDFIKQIKKEGITLKKLREGL